MSSAEECRRRAADAQKQARLAASDHERVAWLRIAQGWLSRLPAGPEIERETFEALSAAIKTTDRDSDTSH